jgi:hypothetical protein
LPRQIEEMIVMVRQSRDRKTVKDGREQVLREIFKQYPEINSQEIFELLIFE